MPAPAFDFVRDVEFRQGLLSDYGELESCLESEAWKACHVLAGSIIEAVLVDHLVGIGQTTPDPLKMSLGELIDACLANGALTSRTADLSSALKSYRNLIHPGRARRLQEVADEDGARVAAALVSIILKEVAKKQREAHGYTAEQLVRKFENDSSAPGIANHLLAETQEAEIERLLLRVVAEEYFAAGATGDSSAQEMHTKLYRAAFDFAPAPLKKKAMGRFVSVLKQGAGEEVMAYEEDFFRAPDLAYLSLKDRALVKGHLFGRPQAELSMPLLHVAEGIGAFLAEEDVRPFVDPLLRRAALGGADQRLARRAKAVLVGEASSTPAKVDVVIRQRLLEWIAFYEQRGQAAAAEVAREIKAAYDAFEDIPF